MKTRSCVSIVQNVPIVAMLTGWLVIFLNPQLSDNPKYGILFVCAYLLSWITSIVSGAPSTH